MIMLEIQNLTCWLYGNLVYSVCQVFFSNPVSFLFILRVEYPRTRPSLLRKRVLGEPLGRLKRRGSPKTEVFGKASEEKAETWKNPYRFGPLPH
jgi:hypothetical protein